MTNTAHSPALSMTDIRATPPGALRGILKFCEGQLSSKRVRKMLGKPELEETKKLASLIRAELGLLSHPTHAVAA